MTTARRLAVLAAAALPLALAGCGGADTCPTEVAKVNSVPASCALAANATVTVTLPLCTRCNQSVPECVVVPPTGAVGDNDFQLDTVAQACTDSSSCPPGESCALPVPSVSCTFRTPAATGTFDFVVIDADGLQRIVPFTVGGTANTTCSG